VAIAKGLASPGRTRPTIRGAGGPREGRGTSWRCRRGGGRPDPRAPIGREREGRHTLNHRPFLTILISLGAATLLIACGSGTTNASRIDDIRRDVERNIPAGASVEEIAASYGSLQACAREGHLITAEQADPVQLVRGHDVPPLTNVYCVIVFENEDHQLRLVFVVDDDLRFERVIILDYPKGL
jgi:hypothetical protein